MTSRFISTLCLMASLTAIPAVADDEGQTARGRQWGVYADVEIPFQDSRIKGIKNNTSMEFSAGVSYQCNFSRQWGLNLDLEFNYGRRFAQYDKNFINSFEKEPETYYSIANIVRDRLSVSLPVMATFRVPFNDLLSLKIGAGPLLRYNIRSKQVFWDENSGEEVSSWWNDNSLSFGLAFEAALETGKHLSYFLRLQTFSEEKWDKVPESIFIPLTDHGGWLDLAEYKTHRSLSRPMVSIGVKYTF